MLYQLDLLNPSIAYMIGFIYADGSLKEDTRNRGTLSIEINSRDAHILNSFKELIPFNSYLRSRTRTTQFKENHESTSLSVFAKEFRDELINIGLNYGKKSDIIKPPNRPFSEIDFIRGFIDGDGSLGISNSRGLPFISVVISSEDFKDYYLDFLERYIGVKKNLKRNKRDNVYNVILLNEDAQKLSSLLYYDDCLCLERKKTKAEEVLTWIRPANLKKRNFSVKDWTAEEDKYILSHSVEESMVYLKRTKYSVVGRLKNLKRKADIKNHEKN